MTSLKISRDDIPDLSGKRVILTGGSSGIGLSAATIFAEKGAWVLNLDVNPPPSGGHANVEYRRCDVSKWEDLLAGFRQAGDIDIAVSNAGVMGDMDYTTDVLDEATGELKEPSYRELDINLRGALNFSKLAISHFRRRKCPGSLVITASSTAYAPEQNVPVYSASKMALIALVRTLRSQLRLEDITVNAVAPAATITAILPHELIAPILAAGLPVSSADFVGLALVYSAVATQPGIVERYGKDGEELETTPSRWNGRTIYTVGDQYTELEGPLSSLRPQWFGETNEALTRLQQAAIDFREV